MRQQVAEVPLALSSGGAALLFSNMYLGATQQIQPGVWFEGYLADVGLFLCNKVDVWVGGHQVVSWARVDVLANLVLQETVRLVRVKQVSSSDSVAAKNVCPATLNATVS